MKTSIIPRSGHSQRGVFLLEVLIAIVIFGIGILSMISMQAVSIAAQNDSQYRSEAEHLIDQLIGQIRMTVTHDTTTGDVVAASFDAFDHHPATLPAAAVAPNVSTGCSVTAGTPSSSTVVTDWIKAVRGRDSADNPVAGKGLPDRAAPEARVQIVTDRASVPGVNQVRVTVCWMAANDRKTNSAGNYTETAHSHSVVAYID